MKILSLFDGISCGMVALERAGIPVERYDAFEIDKYAVEVSEWMLYPISYHIFNKFFTVCLLFSSCVCAMIAVR